MAEAGGEIRECILIITTLKYADELLEQLDRCRKMDDLECYLPHFFRKGQKRDIFPGDRKTSVIPKTIHYIWFGGGSIPEQYLKNIETWKKYCSDYEIVQWNETNYDVTKNLYMYQAYQEGKWGFVPDFARLDIIFHYGGLYFDIDVEMVKPLDDLLQFESFFGFENSFSVNLGHGFGACKGNCIVRDMMESYKGLLFKNEDGSLNMTASPNYQTRVLGSHGLIKNGRTQLIRGGVVLASDYFAPINEYGFGYPTSNTYGVHQYAATWFDEEQIKERQKMIRTCKKIMERIGRNDFADTG